MLFLFNTTVFDLGSPTDLLKAPDAPMPFMTAHSMPIEKVIGGIKEAVFANSVVRDGCPEQSPAFGRAGRVQNSSDWIVGDAAERR